MKLHKTPAKPTAKAAPSKLPAKPGKPTAPAVTGFQRPVMTRPATHVAPPPVMPAKPATPPVDIAALVATIDAQKAEIVKLMSKASKARANVRTPAEILDNGTEGIAAEDWRLPYQGGEISCRQFDKKGATLTVIDGPAVPVLLAIPRSSDPGGEGTSARVTGTIAVHWRRNESGEYEGNPEYLTSDQLVAVWAD